MLLLFILWFSIKYERILFEKKKNIWRAYGLLISNEMFACIPNKKISTEDLPKYSDYYFQDTREKHSVGDSKECLLVDILKRLFMSVSVNYVE